MLHTCALKVMFLKTAHDKAIQCYRDVLKCKPNNYKALDKLIGLLRRAGQLKEVRTAAAMSVPLEKQSGVMYYSIFISDRGRSS